MPLNRSPIKYFFVVSFESEIITLSTPNNFFSQSFGDSNCSGLWDKIDTLLISLD